MCKIHSGEKICLAQNKEPIFITADRATDSSFHFMSAKKKTLT